MEDIKEVEVLTQEVPVAVKEPANPVIVGSETIKDLLDKLNFVKRMIEKNPTVPIIENVLFDKGVIYGTDLNNTAVHMTKIKGTFVMPIADVVKLLSKIKDKNQEIKIVYDESTYSIELLLPKTRFKVSGQNPTDFPKIPIPKQEIGTISEKDIETITTAFKYASTDGLRPAMTGALITNDGATTTDGHRLYLGKFKNPLGIDCSFVIQAKASKILPHLSGACRIKIHEPKIITDGADKSIDCKSYRNMTSGTVSFTDHEKGVFIRLIDERFPDFVSVVPEKFHNTVIIDKAEFTEALEIAMITANKTNHQVRLFLKTENELMVSSEDLDFSNESNTKVDVTSTGGLLFYEMKKKFDVDETTGEIKKEWEERCDIGPVEIGFNAKFLIAMMKDIEEDDVTITMTAANKGVIFNDTVLIMPVMLSEYV